MTGRAPRSKPLKIGDHVGSRTVTALASPTPKSGRQRVFAQCDCKRTGPVPVLAASLRRPGRGCQRCSTLGHARGAYAYRFPTGQAWTALAASTSQRIGLRMRAYRFVHNTSADEMADRLGVDPAVYSRYERNGVVKLAVAEKIAALIGMTLSEIVAEFSHEDEARLRVVFAPGDRQPQRRAA